MDQRLRLMTAAAVMLVGLGVALLFRRTSADAELPISMQSDALVLRKQPDLRSFALSEPSLGQSQSRPLQVNRPEERRSPPTIVTPSDQPAPPPELSKTFPCGSQPPSTRWGASLSEMLPESASAPPTHKIIDGDSLALLAERYLGSASRAMEIYEANRNVLAHPEILPIGTEIRIPRADATSAQAANTVRP